MWSRIAALFSSSRLPPPLLATSILCLKVCLNLELLRGHLEFPRNLAVGQRSMEISPLTYHEVTMGAIQFGKTS